MDTTDSAAKNPWHNRICFQLPGAQYILVEPDKILYIEADGQVCYVWLDDTTKLTAVHNIGYYKALLTQRLGFLEISKSLLINGYHISKYNNRERAVVLSSGKTLTPSKSGAIALHEMFRQYHAAQQIPFEPDISPKDQPSE